MNAIARRGGLLGGAVRYCAAGALECESKLSLIVGSVAPVACANPYSHRRDDGSCAP